MGMLVGAVILACFQIALGYCWFALARGGTSGRAASIAGGALNGFVVLAMMSPILLGQFLVLLACGAIVLARKGRTRTYLGWSLGLTVLLFAYVGFVSLIQWRGLKDKFPFESMANRLAYETQHVRPERPGAADASNSPEPPPSSVLQEMLVRLEETEKAIPSRAFGRNRRAATLRMVHASQVEHFFRESGIWRCPRNQTVAATPRTGEGDSASAHARRA